MGHKLDEVSWQLICTKPQPGPSRKTRISGGMTMNNGRTSREGTCIIATPYRAVSFHGSKRLLAFGERDLEEPGYEIGRGDLVVLANILLEGWTVDHGPRSLVALKVSHIV